MAEAASFMCIQQMAHFLNLTWKPAWSSGTTRSAKRTHNFPRCQSEGLKQHSLDISLGGGGASFDCSPSPRPIQNHGDTVEGIDCEGQSKSEAVLDGDLKIHTRTLCVCVCVLRFCMCVYYVYMLIYIYMYIYIYAVTWGDRFSNSGKFCQLCRAAQIARSPAEDRLLLIVNCLFHAGHLAWANVEAISIGASLYVPRSSKQASFLLRFVAVASILRWEPVDIATSTTCFNHNTRGDSLMSHELPTQFPRGQMGPGRKTPVLLLLKALLLGGALFGGTPMVTSQKCYPRCIL